MRTGIPATGGQHEGNGTRKECKGAPSNDATYGALGAHVGVCRTHEALEGLVEHSLRLHRDLAEHGRIGVYALRMPERRAAVFL